MSLKKIIFLYCFLAIFIIENSIHLGFGRFNDARMWQHDAPGSYYQSEPFVTQEGTFACPSCGKTFTSKRSWKNHNAIHDQGGDGGLTCSFCGKPQSSGTNYRRHLKTVHGVENQ